MDSKLRGYLAEMLGTLIIVFLGAATVCASYRSSPLPLGLAGLALAEGCAVAIALTATVRDEPQGFLNPAITITLWVCKRLDGARTLALLLAQLLGAALAGLAVRYLFEEDVLTAARLGTPHLRAFLDPSERVTVLSLLAGVGVEAIFTAIVTIAVFATLIDPRRPRQGGVGVGLAQIAVVLAGFGLTGGCANPARWFGPAIWQPTVPPLTTLAPFADNTVYWVGPILGALAGGMVYAGVLLPPEH